MDMQHWLFEIVCLKPFTPIYLYFFQTTTHVISSIVHITHEYDNDNEPWPIEIEDHDGKLHAVNLEPGQVQA